MEIQLLLESSFKVKSLLDRQISLPKLCKRSQWSRKQNALMGGARVLQAKAGKRLWEKLWKWLYFCVEYWGEHSRSSECCNIETAQGKSLCRYKLCFTSKADWIWRGHFGWYSICVMVPPSQNSQHWCARELQRRWNLSTDIQSELHRRPLLHSTLNFSKFLRCI